MPEPPEAFSALAITQSMCSAWRSVGKACTHHVDAGLANDIAEEKDTHGDSPQLPLASWRGRSADLA